MTSDTQRLMRIMCDLLEIPQGASTIFNAIDADEASEQVARDTMPRFDRATRQRIGDAMMIMQIAQLREERESDRQEFGRLRAEYDEVMAGRGTSCRHLANVEAALDKRLSVLETRVLIYMGVASAIIMPGISVILSKVF